MPVTGVCLLPPASGNNGIAARLIAHISRRFPEEEHHPFHLEHRLFSDTTSQLPGADVKLRAFTHILTISHDPKHAFVRTTKVGDIQKGSSITIPISSAESFTNLLATKMLPLWYPRQMLSLEHGVTVSLKNDSWRLCIGDARISTRSQGAGTLRGTVVELCRMIDDTGAQEPLTPEETEEFQQMFRDVFNEIFKESGEKYNNVNFVLSKTLPREGTNQAKEDSGPDWDLAELYMTILRGQR